MPSLTAGRVDLHFFGSFTADCTFIFYTKVCIIVPLKAAALRNFHRLNIKKINKKNQTFISYLPLQSRERESWWAMTSKKYQGPSALIKQGEPNTSTHQRNQIFQISSTKERKKEGGKRKKNAFKGIEFLTSSLHPKRNKAVRDTPCSFSSR